MNSWDVNRSFQAGKSQMWMRRLKASSLVGLALALSSIQGILAIDDPARELPGLHNFLKASDTVYQGSEPDSDASFESLQEMGITTIVSVDGATPDVETAKRFGIRYIHIPIGYDGIDSNARLALTRVAKEIQTPVYVHCYHGKHRGPAAVGVLCIAAGTLDQQQATALMTKAGTGKNYTGLWRDVRNFKPPAADEELPKLVEIAPVPSLTGAMAKIDRHFDHLKLCAATDWKPPADHPDLDPLAESLLVQEGLHECLRNLNSDRDEQFRLWLKESDETANALHNAIKSNDQATAHVLLKAVEKTCVQCHTSYRNQ